MRTTDTKDSDRNNRNENDDFVEIQRFEMPKTKKIISITKEEYISENLSSNIIIYRIWK